MAKKHGVAIILCGFLAASVWAATPVPSLMATTPQPSWSELSVPQKIILAPLCDDWDSLESYRQKKWLGIAERFSAMTPLEQQRIQGQMQVWGKLSPDQRELARKNFLTANQLPAEKKLALRQKWLEYSSLSPAEKEALMQQVAGKPTPQRLPAVTSTLPTPAGLKAEPQIDRPIFRRRLLSSAPQTTSLPAE